MQRKKDLGHGPRQSGPSFDLPKTLTPPPQTGGDSAPSGRGPYGPRGLKSKPASAPGGRGPYGPRGLASSSTGTKPKYKSASKYEKGESRPKIVGEGWVPTVETGPRPSGPTRLRPKPKGPIPHPEIKKRQDRQRTWDGLKKQLDRVRVYRSRVVT